MTIRVTKFVVIETGTYNKQYRRPYQSILDHDGMNALAEVIDRTGQITANTLAGVANRLVCPSAQPESEIGIIGGWGERRLRFMLELQDVSDFSTRVQTILGYSDHFGVSMNGTLDPRMEFYINSTIQSRETIAETPLGRQRYLTVRDNSHVLANNNWSGINSGSNEFAIRPQDIYSVMTRQELGELPGGMLDMRNVIRNTPMKSRRQNSVASGYAAQVFEGYRSAQATQDFGQGRNDVLSEARKMMRDPLVSQDPFMSALMNLRGDPTPTNYFTIHELLQLDPHAMSPGVYSSGIMSGATRAASNFHESGTTEYWHVADRHTQVATVLAQTAAAIMMDVGITKLNFDASNLNSTGMSQVRLGDFKSFSNIDMTENLETFRIRFATEVLRDLFYNDEVDYFVTLSVDVLGDTRIMVSIEGSEQVPYVLPTFCDALFAPVITEHDSLSLQLADSFGAVIDELLTTNSQFAETGELKYQF